MVYGASLENWLGCKPLTGSNPVASASWYDKRVMVEIEQQLGEVRYEWTAPEFARAQRSGVWYMVTGGIWLILLAYTLYTGQWVGVAVVIMIGIVLYLLGRVAPRNFIHRLATAGIGVGEKFYPYGQLRSFWIANTPSGQTLNLVSSKKFSLAITLQLVGADVEKVRDILLEFLPEESGRGEDTVDRIGRFLKF